MLRTVLPRLGRLTLTRGLASYPSHTVLGLPALSPTMTSGNIAKYLVKVGDEIQPGDRIAEIETDKATVDFDVVDGGFVAKILIAEGTLLARNCHITQNTNSLLPAGAKADSQEQDICAFGDGTSAMFNPAAGAAACTSCGGTGMCPQHPK